MENYKAEKQSFDEKDLDKEKEDFWEKLAKIETYANFEFQRSGGPGGQNVNKTSTKAYMTVNIEIFSDYQKNKIKERLDKRFFDKNGFIYLTSQETRSQKKNKEIVIEKMQDLLKNILDEKKKRKTTKASKASREKNIKKNKKHKQKKEYRRKPKW